MTTHRLRAAGLFATLVLASCGRGARQESDSPPSSRQTIAAVLIASDPSWGNTEGPAVDSKGTLFFCARGTFKGIVSWTEKDGAKEYLAIDAVNGPGGLWISEQDDIYVTGPGERKVWKVSPDKRVTVLADKFEPDPASSKGPNDLVKAPNGSLYFTDPNGFYGESAPGTIYRLTPEGKLAVFDKTVVGPNGIAISQDGKTIFVAHNVANSTSKVERFPLEEDGSAGARSALATIENCVADGMDVDREGNVWLTCYSFGTAYRISPDGRIQQTITTDQKALTNCFFGRGADRNSLYLTSSDMKRITGYVYRANLPIGGFR